MSLNGTVIFSISAITIPIGRGRNYASCPGSIPISPALTTHPRRTLMNRAGSLMNASTHLRKASTLHLPLLRFSPFLIKRMRNSNLPLHPTTSPQQLSHLLPPRHRLLSAHHQDFHCPLSKNATPSALSILAQPPCHRSFLSKVLSQASAASPPSSKSPSPHLPAPHPLPL
jgi:hypothetical protein